MSVYKDMMRFLFVECTLPGAKSASQEDVFAEGRSCQGYFYSGLCKWPLWLIVMPERRGWMSPELYELYYYTRIRVQLYHQ